MQDHWRWEYSPWSTWCGSAGNLGMCGWDWWCCPVHWHWCDVGRALGVRKQALVDKKSNPQAAITQSAGESKKLKGILWLMQKKIIIWISFEISKVACNLLYPPVGRHWAALLLGFYHVALSIVRVLTECDVSNVIPHCCVRVLQLHGRLPMAEQNLRCGVTGAAALFELLQVKTKWDIPAPIES